MQNNQIKPIHKFILKDKHNLRIAAAVTEAWSEVRAQIVTGFLDKLGTRLRKKLKGWKFESQEHFFIDQYPKYFFWKPAWEAASYYISLECANYGQQMLFGVFRDEERIQKRKFCPELFAAVKKHFDSAVSRPWYEAVVEMQQPATDWRKWDVLWQLHKDNTFLDNVAEQLLDMANISEKIVDGLAKKYA